MTIGAERGLNEAEADDAEPAERRRLMAPAPRMAAGRRR